jgi:hypothetical protein
MVLLSTQLKCVVISGQSFLLSVWPPYKKTLIRPIVGVSVCSVPVCVNAGFIASNWAWLYEPVLRRWSERPYPGDWWACLRFGVTFEPWQLLPWAWQEVKGEGMSVYEAVYTGVIESTVGRTGGNDKVMLQNTTVL